MRGDLLRCVGFFSMCLLVSGVAAAKDSPEPYFINIPGECAVAGNVVANCGFETGAFPPWVFTNDPFYTNIVHQPHTGDWAEESGPLDPNMGFTTQMVPTVPGQVYNLTFWRNNATQPNRFQVSWEGVVVMDVSDVPNQPYMQFRINGLAACFETGELKFGFYNRDGFFHLDDVVLSPATDGEEE